MEKKYTYEDFIAIVSRLRSPDGCPWDKVQTHDSLKKCILEETYEVIDAIDNQDMENLCEELGDVLLQVVFHSQIEKEMGRFTMEDVVDGISKKMISRHPHIFSDASVDTPEEVLQNWEEIKKKEKGCTSQTEVLNRIPKSLPALIRAQKVQSKAKDTGFDFTHLEQVLDKISEEAQELKEALSLSEEKKEEEFGDLLFSIVNLSRFLQLNAEFALTKATEKFINRFGYVEKSVLSQGKKISDMTMDDLDAIWEQSKQHRHLKTKKYKNQEEETQ